VRDRTSRSAVGFRGRGAGHARRATLICLNQVIDWRIGEAYRPGPMIEAPALSARRAPTDDRRAAIAKAARELIVEKGVEGLRTRDVAERVGINVATMHYHVPTKEALFELVAESLQLFFREQSIMRPRAHLSAHEKMD